MSKKKHPLIFILGPSGAGKSDTAKHLANVDRFTHFEIDRYPHGDGIDEAGLRAEWDPFCLRGEGVAQLADAVHRKRSPKHAGVVLSFPSPVVFEPNQLAKLEHEGVTVIALVGTATECLLAFLAREKEEQRLPGVDLVSHWNNFSWEPFKKFVGPSYSSVRLNTFENGARRSRPSLLADVRARFAK
jgi:hypothetical protein